MGTNTHVVHNDIPLIVAIGIGWRCVVATLAILRPQLHPTFVPRSFLHGSTSAYSKRNEKYYTNEIHRKFFHS